MDGPGEMSLSGGTGDDSGDDSGDGSGDVMGEYSPLLAACNISCDYYVFMPELLYNRLMITLFSL